MKLGVCYYPEHWPAERWAEDARLMREAGIALVRVGEFAWSKIEPFEDQWNLEWLDEAIHILAAEGIKIVMGTPTAAPPAWLIHAHPEILPVDSQGRRLNFGSRREYCSNSPVYQEYTRRIVTTLAERYGKHPAVVAWQIDNEFGCHNTARCYCPECVDKFRVWLKDKYGSTDALNAAWGNVFWSQTFTDWEQIPAPILMATTPNPAHTLDYYRFSSDSVAAFETLQANILREHTERQITTNFMGAYGDLDYHRLAQPIDFASWDSYPTGWLDTASNELYDSDEPHPHLGFDVGDPYATGFQHDLTRGLKQKPFWVMEQQAGHINWGLYNTLLRPGTVRLWTWHALASGANAVLYFRWRAALYGQEQYHSGLLHHDATPDLGYREVLNMRKEQDLMTQISQADVTASVALLLDYESLWAVQLQPHRRESSYLRTLFTFYHALQRLGITVDIVSPTADLSNYRLVITGSSFIGRAETAQALENFVQNGGWVMLTSRSGSKTVSNLVTDQTLPGVFRKLVGARVTDWGSLNPGIGVSIQSAVSGLMGPATNWIESIEPEAAHSIAEYSSGPYAWKAAMVENRLGGGRALYLGFTPTHAQAQAIIGHLAHELFLPRAAENLPLGMLACQRGNYTILLNFTDESAIASVQEMPITVPPRGVRVINLDNRSVGP